MNPRPHKSNPLSGKGAAKRRPRKASRFGDLCESTEGLAAEWRRLGCTEAEIRAFKDDSPFILSCAVPFLHAAGFSEEDVVRHVPHDGMLAEALFAFLGVFGNRTLDLSDAAEPAAVPAWMAAAFLRRTISRRIAAMRNKAARGLHYEAEKAKRRAMAAERRRISRRTTTSPCPTRGQVLEAWRHVRDSKEALVRFGSVMQDLECYVDNSLRHNEYGEITGRNAGVKGWLRENLPELSEHYSMVMRYKAAAKKLRQVVGLADPTPVAEVLADGGGEEEGACNHGAEKKHADGAPAVEVVRARAVYLEAMEGVPDVAARVLERIDALCDPERTDEAATLRSWRERYEREITVRRKDSWWERLKSGLGRKRRKTG